MMGMPFLPKTNERAKVRPFMTVLTRLIPKYFLDLFLEHLSML